MGLSLKIALVVALLIMISQAVIVGYTLGKIQFQKDAPTNVEIVLWCQDKTIKFDTYSSMQQAHYADCVQNLVEAKAIDEKAR